MRDPGNGKQLPSRARRRRPPVCAPRSSARPRRSDRTRAGEYQSRDRTQPAWCSPGRGWWRRSLRWGCSCLAGYQLGASLASSDGLELVAALFDDLGLFTTAPGDVAAALGEVIPWSLVALAAVGAGLLVLAAGHVVSRAPAAQRTRQIA